jgi:polysaccharide biosynthesis protein PslA
VTAQRSEGNQAASIPPQVICLARVIGVVLAVLSSFEVLWRTVDPPPNHIRLWLLLIALLVGLAPAPGRSLGRQRKIEGRLQDLGDVLVATLCTLGTAAGVAWITDQRPPAGVIFLVLGCAAILVPACRRLVERFGAALSSSEQSYLVYGNNATGMAVARFLTEARARTRIVGFIDEGGGPLDNQASSLPVFRDLHEMAVAFPDLTIDGVVIALPGATTEDIVSIRAKLRQRIPKILLAPPMAVLAARWPIEHEPQTPNCYLLGAKEFSFDVKLVKRAIDIVIASIALVAFAPVMLVCAALIKLESPGPVIFRQCRFTTDNRLFECYKFRTMRWAPPTGRIELTLRRDSRVTRVGNFLRRTSLDEIPQFINVLQGHMSVVGPRPHPPGVMAAGRTYEDIVTDFGERYKVKPGLTGFAQISGLRGNTFTEEDVRQRFQHDIEYITHWSLALEFWIIFKTFSNGFWGKNVF